MRSIRVERELRRDTGYTPTFTNVPIRISEFDVTLDENDYALLQQCKLKDLYGDDDGAALRDILVSRVG